MEHERDLATESDPPPEPVTPPPADVAPSSTGVVDGDPDQAVPVGPSDDNHEG